MKEPRTDPETNLDTSVDSGIDSGIDSGTDSGTDSSVNSGMSNRLDISTDSQIDINTETSTDADAVAASRSDEQHRGYIQQLRWRSRRGLLELELLLLPFATDRLDALDESALGDYERLLGCEDLDIYDWLQQRSAPDDDTLLKIVTAIRDYQQSLKHT